MLYDQIKSGIVTAMKSQDDDRTQRLTVLRGLKSAIDLEVKSTFGTTESADLPPADELVEKVLVRELKKRQDSMAQYAQVGAMQLHAAEQAEAAIISAFLPQQMERAEVEAKLAEVVAAQGKNIGPVMKEMRAFCGARFNGKELADMVKSSLA